MSNINRSNLQKLRSLARRYAPRDLYDKIREKLAAPCQDYPQIWQSFQPGEEELQRQREARFSYAPLMSIVVPAYETDELFLRQMIDSVIAQTYPNWELCVADGSPGDQVGQTIARHYAGEPRVKYKKLERNEGISGNTNQGFAMAEGEYIGLLDHDDLLAPNALYEIAKVLETEPDTDVIYTDEDKVRGEDLEHFQPHLKPDFSPDLLRSNNYICHFFVVRKTIAERIGGFFREYDGAQDYDFIFRCTEQAGKIRHVPEILYHWRTHEASTADNPESKLYAFEAGKRAIEANLKRSGLKGEVTQTKDYGFYRVKYPVAGNPMVSIIIPNKDAKEDLEKCINSILGRSSYSNYEILVVENNSTSQEIFEYYKQLAKRPKVRLLKWKKEFNYSAINNFAAARAKGEYLLFLNNDTEVITSDWIEEMLGFCQRQDTGIVGAKLYYGNDTIQHAGTVIGIGGIAGHMFVDLPRERSGYMHKASIIQDLSAVTAACMMIKKQIFDEAQGFEEALSVAFNDVDLCLRVRKLGYLVVYDPYVELYHYIFS